MAKLGPGQKPIVMPHYPHFLAEDTEVWTKYLKSDHIKIEAVWYDVRVGMSVLRNEGGDSMLSKIADGLTRKRIDVIAEVDGGLWIIEVKPYANMYAVGQVVTYQRLFVKDYSITGTVAAVIVCDDYDEDLLDEFDEFGILVIRNE